jgi:HD-GYP domain-containing protein (c-di-GMP phosphodiesterase class II)
MVAVANEDRFPYLRGHSARVLAYAQPLGQAVGLRQSETGALQIAARLHDIGYVVIPHTAINHSGPLSDDQWECVRRHPAVGADFLKPLEFFGDVGSCIRAHHESYDGTGYPDQKAGEEIPLVARVLTVADAFDGMTSHRPFRGAIAREDALEQIRKLAGQQFDPQVVEALVGLPKETLDEIADSWR